MNGMTPREAVGYMIYRWDALTDLDRTDADYLAIASSVLVHGSPLLADAERIADAIAIWDVTEPRARTRDDYLEIADLALTV
ncbi:hypothetical protein [Streptomyces sp. DSM 41534]